MAQHEIQRLEGLLPRESSPTAHCLSVLNLANPLFHVSDWFGAANKHDSKRRDAVPRLAISFLN